MLEPLRMIPGPLFLLGMIGLTGLAVYFHFFRPWGPRRADPLVEMQLTPYELAYLARGPRGVIETALATAHADGFLHVNLEAKLATALANAQPRDPVLRELLEELTEHHGSIREITLARSIASLREDLEHQGLIDNSSRGKRILRGLTIFGGLIFVASLKIGMGRVHHRPSEFLQFLSTILFFLLVASVFAKGRKGAPTIAGRRCVENRRQALEALLHNPQAVRQRPDARPMLTSVFGFQQLSNSPWTDIIPLAGLAIATSPLWMAPPVSSSGFFGTGGSSGSFDVSTSSSTDSGCGGGSSGGDSGCGGGGGCGGCGGGGGD